MISKKELTTETDFQNSKKIYIIGSKPTIRVPFREITLSPTKSHAGQETENAPMRVYDTSGPWTDPEFHGDVRKGLSPMRAEWIRGRGDVEEIKGRSVHPRDNGYLSQNTCSRLPSGQMAGAIWRNSP